MDEVKISLSDVPELTGIPTTSPWKVKVLRINGESPLDRAFIEWKKNKPKDLKKILASMEIAASTPGVAKHRRIRACSNPEYAGTYEFKASNCQIRVMYFYDDLGQIIICCVPYEKKSSGKKQSEDQNSAFRNCYQLMELYNNMDRNKG